MSHEVSTEAWSTMKNVQAVEEERGKVWEMARRAKEAKGKSAQEMKTAMYLGMGLFGGFVTFRKFSS